MNLYCQNISAHVFVVWFNVFQSAFRIMCLPAVPKQRLAV
jgi:hypothetical protein